MKSGTFFPKRKYASPVGFSTPQGFHSMFLYESMRINANETVEFTRL
jgi:hypothetical protein